MLFWEKVEGDISVHEILDLAFQHGADDYNAALTLACFYGYNELIDLYISRAPSGAID